MFFFPHQGQFPPFRPAVLSPLLKSRFLHHLSLPYQTDFFRVLDSVRQWRNPLLRFPLSQDVRGESFKHALASFSSSMSVLSSLYPPLSCRFLFLTGLSRADFKPLEDGDKICFREVFSASPGGFYMRPFFYKGSWA